MELHGIAHLGLSVSDLETSLAFWRDGLGLEVVRGQRLADPSFQAITGEAGAVARQAVLATADRALEVELMQYETPSLPPVSARPPAPGSSHLALRCTGIEELAARLVAAGGSAVSGPTLSTGKAGPRVCCYLRDPDGHLIELIEAA